MTQKNTVPLPEETILAGRYVLGNPRAVSDAGIAYNAFDKKLRMPCEVFEFLPVDCASRGRKGAVVAKDGTDPKIFADKCQQLRSGAIQRFKDSDSAIYDLIAANGSVYLVQVCAKNNAYPGNAVPSPAEVPDDPDDAVTREIGGLFAASAPIDSDDTPVSEDPTVTFPFALLKDTSETSEESEKPQETKAEPVPVVVPPTKKSLPQAEDQPQAHPNTKVKIKPETTQKPASKPAPRPVKKIKTARDEVEEDVAEDKKLNMKLLVILLAGVVILLVLGVIIFLSVLQQITGTVDDPNSLLGIPITEIDENRDGDYLIVGSGSNTQYAPGMVIEEKQNGNVLHVLINGVFPAYVMPDLSGMTYESARALLERTPYCNTVGNVNAKIDVEEVSDNTYAPGAVVSQYPKAGDVVTADQAVTLKIAVNATKTTLDKEISMPDLCGKTYASSMAGHPILVRDRIYCADIPAGTVLHQYPAAGETWVDGGVCYVVVSAGAEKTYVPDMLYSTLEQAIEMLYVRGLSVKTEYAYNSNVKEGLVMEQSLSGGKEASFGDVVVLTVSGEGKAHTGPAIQNDTDTAVLQIGDTCTMELDTGLTVIYHSTNPSVVTVDTAGTVTALAAGSAVITASLDGTTIAMPITVEYPVQETVTGIAQMQKDFSIFTLLEENIGDWQWKILQGDGTLSDLGIFLTDAPGKVILGGTNGNRAALILLTVKNSEPISITKDLIKKADEAKKLLEDKGLVCILKEEYSDAHPAGTVLRIQYSGYSDDKEYHFTAGSTVTLIVSSGKLGVTSIAIAEKPAKLTYTVGEKLDTTGLVVSVTYEDGTVQNITSGFNVSYDFSTAGRKTVAVSFGDRKASFHVEIVSASAAKLTIVSLPDQTTYFVNDTLNTVGLEIQITTPDGSTKRLVQGYSVSYSFDKVGTSEVVVSMDGLSASFTVTVVENKVEYLELVKYPQKVSYFQGDTLDTTGMQLRAYYADDTVHLVNSGWTVTADLTTNLGESIVVVTYGGKTVQFMVMVRAPEIESVEIQKTPTKTLYLEGDTVDLAGLALTVTLSNGKTEKITYPNDSISCTYDFTAAGEKTVTVDYLGYKCQFRVTVKPAEIVELSVQTLPKKLVYLPGETLDTTGLVLLVKYQNDVQKTITTGFTTSCDLSKPGEVKVSVCFGNMETSFTVTVSKDALLYTDPASLTLNVGESQMVRVICLLADQNVSFSVSDSSVISVIPVGSALSVTALADGESTITLQSATLTATCKVTVSDIAPSESFTAQMTVSDKTDQYFMKTLELTGSKTRDVEVEFSAAISYDPTVLHLGDYGIRYKGLTLQYDGVSNIILSGKVIIPKGETVAVAYCIFMGKDPSACVFSIQ